jgi:hypothetical protein
MRCEFVGTQNKLPLEGCAGGAVEATVPNARIA